MNELISRGLHRQYRRRDERLSAPRGRLDFGRLARSGVVAAELPCRHHLRTEDCLPNAVLLAGLLAGAHMTRDQRLRTGLRRTAGMFEGVHPVDLTPDVFRRLDLERTRLLTAYAPALRIVELLAIGQGVATQGDASDVAFPGFLFVMNNS